MCHSREHGTQKQMKMSTS